MPHRAPGSVGRAFRECLPDAVARLNRQRADGSYAPSENLLVLYRISEPGRPDEAAYGIFAGTGAFMVATVISLALAWWLYHKVPVMPLVSAVIVLAFGGLTLYLQDETFIKLKPTIVYAMFAVLLLGGLIAQKPVLALLFGPVVVGRRLRGDARDRDPGARALLGRAGLRPPHGAGEPGPAPGRLPGPDRGARVHPLAAERQLTLFDRRTTTRSPGGRGLARLRRPVRSIRLLPRRLLRPDPAPEASAHPAPEQDVASSGVSPSTR